MILARTVFQATFGRGGELARQMAEGMDGAAQAPAGAGRWRILTDLTSGPFDTVVLEGEWTSLAAWEQARREMFADAAFQDAMRRTADLIQSGRSELYTIEAEGGP